MGKWEFIEAKQEQRPDSFAAPLERPSRQPLLNDLSSILPPSGLGPAPCCIRVSGSVLSAPLKLLLAAPLLASLLGGCSLNLFSSLSSRDCLARAMYFESNRSSPEGMLAVGTVVMNRLADKAYPKTVCGVVGQKNQFAPGVLVNPMTEKSSRALAYQMADKVLAGARHPTLGRDVKNFHTAGYQYPYNNMYYVLEAGGNNFYEKRKAGTFENNPFLELAYW